MNRPMPPKDLGQFVNDFPLTFTPALDMPLWVRDTFLNPSNKLFNQDHYHLDDYIDGEIGFLWAATGFETKGRYIIGQTEPLMFRCSKWQKWRQEQQMHEWFGLQLPEFIITLSASYCEVCSDAEFCALVEHELYHIAHEYKGDMPQFNRDNGKPKIVLRGHDVEEFVGVVRRYGVGDPSGKLAALVDAANNKPTIKPVDISNSCGTCLRLVA
jgi:hypothetical protein